MFETLLANMLHGIIFGGAISLIAAGFSLVLGISDIPNMAQGAFSTLAVYTVVFIMSVASIGLTTSSVLSLILLTIFSLLVYKLLLTVRHGRDFLFETVLLTFALSLSISQINRLSTMAVSGNEFLLINTGLNQVASVGPFSIPVIGLLTLIVSIALLICVRYYIRHSVFGRAVRAVANNPLAASIMGVNVNRVRMITFALGASMSAVAGLLYTMNFAITPESGLTFTIYAFTVVLLGGIGNLIGTLFGSIFLGIILGATATYIGGANQLALTFAIVIFILLVFPKGLTLRRE